MLPLGLCSQMVRSAAMPNTLSGPPACTLRKDVGNAGLPMPDSCSKPEFRPSGPKAWSCSHSWLLLSTPYTISWPDEFSPALICWNEPLESFCQPDGESGAVQPERAGEAGRLDDGVAPLAAGNVGDGADGLDRPGRR